MIYRPTGWITPRLFDEAPPAPDGVQVTLEVIPQDINAGTIPVTLTPSAVSGGLVYTATEPVMSANYEPTTTSRLEREVRIAMKNRQPRHKHGGAAGVKRLPENY